MITDLVGVETLDEAIVIFEDLMMMWEEQYWNDYYDDLYNDYDDDYYDDMYSFEEL